MSLWYSFIDLLPFSWAQSGHMIFMKNALLALVVCCILFGILSTMVVQNRMSFFSDALGHSAFAGVAVGSLMGLAEPMWAACLLSLVFSFLITAVQRRTKLSGDTVIGVFSATAVALGILLVTMGGGSMSKYNALLIGDILSVTPGKIAALSLVLLVVVVFWCADTNRLLLSAVHPALADSRGVRVFLSEAILNALIAVIVTITIPWVGLLVINALLVLPAATARNIARNMRQYHLFSVIFSLAAGIAGLMISFYWETSAGAAVTLCLALLFSLSLLFRSRRSS